ncbi:ATP-dependent sacrificial sulfur transferase LarE [Candidatus Cyanaurora vandensis]|uniref:ATP-dependent sacrificial sulfur transferase LarE n=1 Tax=Candidatus Cyanaurora vandensis TaxID=2714958 RepID=UPI00257D7029|nr:ATP-dependent sacrificial sulfur transferase LarE [Candidatus Cyanaurora vandensis]
MLPVKLQQLQTLLASLERCVIAYSGGVDSTLVAKVAFDVLGPRMLAVTAASPSLMQEDLDEAYTQAEFIGMPHLVIETHELENPNYTSNPANRCYFCKSELHGSLVPLAQERGYGVVLDGANLDDLGDYRPGFQAARERGVRSPLIECQIAKFEVRQLSEYLGLPWWNKPAMPCLASRFPYGEEITPAKLQRLAQAESYLRQLGWRNFRVRSDRDTARIELTPDQLSDFVQTVPLPELVDRFKSFGYTYVTLDLEGYRRGKLNEVLSLGDRALTH